MLVPGDLYVSLKGATKDGEMIGSVARLPSTVPSGRLTQDTVRLVFLERDATFERYFYWLLRTPDYRDYCAGRATGSAVVALSRQDFLSYNVPHLTPRRRCIVDVLESIEDKIESNRRAIDLSLRLLDALAEQWAESLPRTPLRELTSINRVTANPSQMGDVLVDHFSLPAFDASARPEVVPASTIKSNKTHVTARSVLVSRLNPRTNRTWWATPRAGIPALASTEFACLVAPGDRSLAGLWLAVRDPRFRAELARRVTGTSGSHQRVRPDDLLVMVVPDVRAMPKSVTDRALLVLELVEKRRDEIWDLESLRDALLPELLSGRARVRDTVT